jgi:crotonobetainyl-CoA:carnitine CoA-transferase CaiB-like acyl-CoA transferase
VKLSRTPASIYVSAPDAGEHSDAILTEVGLSLDEIAALRDRNVI